MNTNFSMAVLKFDILDIKEGFFLNDCTIKYKYCLLKFCIYYEKEFSGCFAKHW